MLLLINFFESGLEAIYMFQYIHVTINRTYDNTKSATLQRFNTSMLLLILGRRTIFCQPKIVSIHPCYY